MPESPIGSIIAFGGHPTRAWEDQTGWLHCDGRLLDRRTADYSALFDAIHFAWGGDGDTMFNVPDLQGFFLRGVDAARERPTADTQVPFPVDPDRDDRIPARLGGSRGQAVGSVQLSATALPLGRRFEADLAGEHSHGMNFETSASRDVNGQFNTVAFPWDPQFVRPQTDVSGSHKHEIIGGDRETRPVNAYVHWIIRYK